MGFATSFIAFVAITLTATSFTDFIMSIVMTTKYKEVFGGWASSYPDVAVAGIVIGTLSMSYMVLYWLFSKRSFMSVRNVLAVTGFFALFNLGLSIAITVKRHDYCSIPEGTIPNSGKLVGLGSPGDCQGVYRGFMGISWSTFILQLIFIGMLVGLVSENKRDGATMATPVGKIPLPIRSDDKEHA